MLGNIGVVVFDVDGVDVTVVTLNVGTVNPDGIVVMVGAVRPRDGHVVFVDPDDVGFK